MPMYKLITCAECGWALNCNGVSQTLRTCPECAKPLRSVQAQDPRHLLEWCKLNEVSAPLWLVDSTPVG